MKDLLTGLAFIVAILTIMTPPMAVLPKRIPADYPTEANFRAACEAVKGRAVWNGRHWECLK